MQASSYEPCIKSTPKHGKSSSYEPCKTSLIRNEPRMKCFPETSLAKTVYPRIDLVYKPRTSVVYSHSHQPKEHRTDRGQNNNEGTHRNTTIMAGTMQYGNNQTREDPTNMQQGDDSRQITTPQTIRQTHLRPQRQIEGEENDVAQDEGPADDVRRLPEHNNQHAFNLEAAIDATTITSTTWLHQSPQYVQVHIGR